MSARVWSLLLLCLLAGCSRDAHKIDSLGDPNDLVIVAVKADADTWQAQLAPRRTPQALDFPPEAQVVVFDLPADSLLDVAHQPASVELRAGLQAVVDPSRTSGTCGRCLAWPGTEAQILLPGQSCPIPSFASAVAYARKDSELQEVDDAELISEAMSQVSLRVAGECQCERPEFTNSDSGEVCVGWPEESPVSFYSVSIGKDGTVMGAQPGFTFFSNGATDEQQLVVFNPPLSDVDGVHVLSSTLSIMSTKIANVLGDRSRLRIFTNGVPSVFRDEGTHEIQFIDTYQDEPVLMGEVGQLPFAERCRSTQAGLQCFVQETDLSACRRFEGGFSDHWEMDGGDRLGAAAGSQMLAWSNNEAEPRWRCDPNTDRPTVETPSGPQEIRLSRGVAALGRRVFTCGVVDVGPGYTVVRHALMPDASLVDQGLDWSVADLRPGRFCRNFEKAGDELQVSLGQVFLRLAADGTAREIPLAEAYPGLSQSPRLTRQVGAYLVAEGRDGSIYRRRPGEDFEPVHAIPPRVGPSRLAAAEDGTIHWLQPPNRVLSARRPASADCGRITIEEAQVSDLNLDGVAIDFLLPTQSGTWMVLGRRGDESLRFDLELGTTPRLVRQRQLTGATAAWVSVVEASRERFVLLASDGAVAVLEDDAVQVLPAVWDDPNTPFVETAPIGDAQLHGLSFADGVVWGSGRASLSRIVPGRDGRLVHEAFWFTRTYAEEMGRNLPRYSPPQAFCADDVVVGSSEVFGGREGFSFERRVLLTLRLGPPSAQCTGGEAEVLMCPMENWQADLDGHLRTPSIQAVLPVREGVVLAMGDGALVPLDRPRLALPIWGPLRAAGTEGFVGIADNAGRVAFWVREAAPQ